MPRYALSQSSSTSLNRVIKHGKKYRTLKKNSHRSHQRKSYPRPVCKIEYRIINNITDFEALDEQWQQLVINSKVPFLCQSHQWLLQCLSAFSEHQPFILVAENEQGALVGALPLQLRKDKPFNVLEFIGSSPLIYDQMGWLIGSGVNTSEVLSGFANLLKNCDDQWHIINLQLLPQSTQLASWHMAMAQAGLPLTSTKQDINPILQLDKSWIKQPQRKNLKSNINRFTNRLKRDFKDKEITLTFYPAGEKTTEKLHYFAQQHCTYWQQKNITSAFKTYPQLIALYNQLLNFTATKTTKSKLCFSSLDIDGQPMCYELGMIEDDSYLCYIRYYEDDFERYSPGTLHHYYIIRQLLEEDKITQFDFGRGDEPYKYRWTNDAIDLYQVSGFSSPLAKTYWNIQQTGKLCRKALKKQMLQTLKIAKKIMILF